MFFYICYISYCFNQIWAKNKYELSFKDGNLGQKTIFVITACTHFIWIIIAVLILKILKKIKLYNLKENIPIIIGGYLWSALLIIFALPLCFNYLINQQAPIGKYFNEKTYIYFLVFLVIWIFGRIPYLFLKLTNSSLKKLNISKYNKIFDEYSLLNKYLLLIITFFLQALSFDGAEKELIDALFYTTAIFALMSECKKWCLILHFSIFLWKAKP